MLSWPFSFDFGFCWSDDDIIGATPFRDHSQTAPKMADSSEDEDDEEMARLKEATAGVSEITSKDPNKIVKKKNDHNDMPARMLTRLLDEMYLIT